VGKLAEASYGRRRRPLRSPVSRGFRRL